MNIKNVTNVLNIIGIFLIFISILLFGLCNIKSTHKIILMAKNQLEIVFLFAGLGSLCMSPKKFYDYKIYQEENPHKKKFTGFSKGGVPGYSNIFFGILFLFVYLFVLLF